MWRREQRVRVASMLRQWRRHAKSGMLRSLAPVFTSPAFEALRLRREALAIVLAFIHWQRHAVTSVVLSSLVDMLQPHVAQRRTKARVRTMFRRWAHAHQARCRRRLTRRFALWAAHTRHAAGGTVAVHALARRRRCCMLREALSNWGRQRIDFALSRGASRLGELTALTRYCHAALHRWLHTAIARRAAERAGLLASHVGELRRLRRGLHQLRLDVRPWRWRRIRRRHELEAHRAALSMNATNGRMRMALRRFSQRTEAAAAAEASTVALAALSVRRAKAFALGQWEAHVLECGGAIGRIARVHLRRSCQPPYAGAADVLRAIDLAHLRQVCALQAL